MPPETASPLPPGSSKRIWHEDLHRFLGAEPSVENFIRFGEARLSTLETVRQKADFLLDLASVWTKNFSNVQASLDCLIRAASFLESERSSEEEAFSLYLQALSHMPNNQAAFSGIARICSQRKYWKKLPAEYQLHLERLLSEHGQWDELLDIYRGQVEIPEDTRQVALTYLKMGEILEMNLKRMDAALNAYKMAQALYPMDIRAFEAVWQLLSRLQRWSELKTHLESQLEFLEDTNRKISLYLELAVLSERELHDLGQAVFYYQKVLELDPKFFPAYEALAKIYQGRGEPKALYRLWHLQRKSLNEPRLLSATLEFLGRLCLYELKMYDEAEDHLLACLQIHPSQLSALRGLDFLYSKTKQLEKQIPVLKDRATHSQDILEKSRMYGRLGRIFWDAFKDAKQSELYFRKMVENTPRKLLGLRLLERLYRESDNLQGRIQVYRERAELAADPESRKSILMELAQLLEGKLGESALAERVYQEINQIVPGFPTASGSLKRLYREQERWEELRTLCLDEIKSTSDEVLRVENLLSLAELEEYQFENLDEAASFYQQVFQLNPRNLAALKGLERIYLKGKKWLNLQEIYRQGMELAQDLKEEAYLCFRMGEVAEHLANEVRDDRNKERVILQEVIRHMESALLRDPEMIAAQKSLIVYYGRLEDWESQLRIQKMLAEFLSEPLERADLYFRMAEVLEQKLGREEESLEIYERAARLDPGHVGVLKRLASFYYQNENWVKALSVHEALEAYFRQGRMPESGDLGRFYYRLGRIDLKLGRYGDALAALSQAKTLSPDFLPIRLALAELYFFEKKWPLLREELHDVMDSVDGEEKMDVLLKLGTAEAAMGNLKESEKYFLEVLDQDPLNEIANTTLVSFYQTHERFDDLAKLYRERMVALDSPEVNMKEGLRLAQLQAGVLNEPASALDTLRKLIANNPDQVEVFQLYRELLRRQKSYEELVEAINDRIVRVTQDEERRGLRLELAEVLELQRGASSDAQLIYQELIDEDPQSLPALKGLGRVYLQQKRWRELIEVYEMERRLCTSDEEAAVISFKIGEIQASQLKREEDAILSYKDAFTKDPGMLPAIRALRKLYEKRSDHERIPPLLIREIEMAQGRGEEARLHYELGKFFEQKLSRLDRAIKHYEDALSVFPTYAPAGRRLAVHYYQSGDWLQAEKYYDLLALDFTKGKKTEIVPHVAAGFFYKYARIAEHLGKDEKAIHCYRRSLEFQEDFFPSLSALAKLCERREWWDEAKLCIEQILRLNPDPATTDIAEWQVALAKMEEKLGNREMAIARHKEVLKNRPDYLPSLEALLHYYEVEKKWRIAIGLYDKLIQISETNRDREALFGAWMAKGRIWETELQEISKAADCYTAAVEKSADPEKATQARKKLIDLYWKGKEWQRLTEILPEMLREHSKTFGNKLDYRLALAQAYLELGVEPERAQKEILVILQRDPIHRKALALEGMLLRQLEEWEPLAGNIQKRLEILAPEQTQEKSILHHELGDLYVDHLGDQSKALMLYRKAVDFDASNIHLHRKLAALYSTNEDFYQQAIKEHHFLLLSDPFNEDSYHNLGHIYEARGEHDRARLIYESLQLLGQVGERELDLIRRMTQKRTLPSHILTETFWKKSLLDPLEETFLREMWGLIAESLAPLFQDLAPSIKQIEKIPWEEEAGLFAQMVDVVGVKQVNLLLLPKKTVQVELLPTLPASIVISRGILEPVNESAKRFLFGKYLAHVRLQHALPLCMPEEQLRRLFLIVAKCVRDDLLLEGYEEKALKADLKKIRRALPKKVLRNLQQPVEAFLESLKAKDSSQVYFASWLRGMQQSSNRVGLLLGQDLRTALAMLQLNDAKAQLLDLSRGRDLQQFLQMNAVAQELFKYSTSQAFFELREQMGLAHMGLVL